MTTKSYGRRAGTPLGYVLGTLPGKVVSHWLFQGMTYMDPTERRFKIALDVVGTLAVAPFFVSSLGWGGSAVVGLGLAHSANFVFNGHLRGALKWHGLGGTSAAATARELHAIAARISADPSVENAWIFGSFSRGELHAGSDLDIRVLRRSGVRAAMGACLLVLRERTRSLVSGVPIDIYVWDSVRRMDGMRTDEAPVPLRALVPPPIPGAVR